jgi:hypothetical protein
MFNFLKKFPSKENWKFRALMATDLLQHIIEASSYEALPAEHQEAIESYIESMEMMYDWKPKRYGTRRMSDD